MGFGLRVKGLGLRLGFKPYVYNIPNTKSHDPALTF